MLVHVFERIQILLNEMEILISLYQDNDVGDLENVDERIQCIRQLIQNASKRYCYQ